MMTRFGTVFLMMFFLAAIGVRSVDAQVGPVVISPRQGQVLQGVVTIRGSSDLSGFVSAEVAFTYSTDTTGTWFLISKSSQPVRLDTLATWDTTTITDGEYILRLRVHLKGGSSVDLLVTNLRVRNYTPVETPTPEPTAILPTATLIPTLTFTPYPLPTPLPTNPAILTPVDVSKSIAYGGFGAVLFLIVIGVYFTLRRR
jgi:hypothetical protein